MNIEIMSRCLPMLASVLGRKYGVSVEIGGERAYTDGNVIHLPSLPLESNEVVRNLIMGFLDHESAHVRHTDFDVLNDPTITPLTKCFWNIFEDWRVENELAKIYPGCKINFDWLIMRHFAKKPPDDKNSAAVIANYILLSVRAWDVPAIENNRDILGKQVQDNYPNLYSQINDLLSQVKANCQSSWDCMDYAKDLVKLIENESVKMDSLKLPGEKGKGEKLQKLLGISGNDLDLDMGKSIAGELESVVPHQDKALIVASEAKKKFLPLSSNEIKDTKRASTALHARLQSLLQSSILKRSSPSRFGKLDTKRLYKLEYSSKLFLRKEQKQGVSSATHVLLDCSASMRHKMELTCMACYAIADSMSRINGINFAVTAFPSDPLPSNPVGCSKRNTVSSLLRHGENLHKNFKMRANGSTPMGEAIWRVMQDMYFLPETRKIILILTDGKPDSEKNATKAIEMGRELGFEFYGIGIVDMNIISLLPHSSQVINSIGELAPAIFSLLQKALLQN